jgi:MFS family permease
MVLVFALIQALVWIPITYLAYQNTFFIWNLILLVVCYWVCGTIITPAWSSWIGDIVPDKIKGKFFGKRNMYMGLTLFLSTLLAGLVLSIASQYSIFIGFTIIFSIAFISKMISWFFIKDIREPEFYVEEEEKFSFLEFIKRLPTTNFGKFVIYLALMTFATHIASPYFVVYMLKNLGMSYFTYTILTTSGKIANFAFIAAWGKYSDLFGNRKIMALTGYMIPLIPFLWLVSSNPIYLIFVQIYGGFVWSGFNVSTFSFIFDNVSPQKRIRCVSFSNVINGLAIFLGATLGGFLMDTTILPISFLLVLVVSGTGRYLSSVIMLPRIKEVRWVNKVSEPKLLLNVVSGTFEGLKYPVLFLSDKRVIIRKRGKDIVKWLQNIIEKISANRHS